MRVFFFVVGLTSLALGIVGIFLPVLPTTPFLLLAAACFAKSSARLYNWLLNSRMFGRIIQDWRNHRCVALKTKIVAISMLVVTIGSSAFFFIPLVPVKIIVVSIGICVAIYIARLPTCR